MKRTSRIFTMIFAIIPVSIASADTTVFLSGTTMVSKECATGWTFVDYAMYGTGVTTCDGVSCKVCRLDADLIVAQGTGSTTVGDFRAWVTSEQFIGDLQLIETRIFPFILHILVVYLGIVSGLYITNARKKGR